MCHVGDLQVHDRNVHLVRLRMMLESTCGRNHQVHLPTGHVGRAGCVYILEVCSRVALLVTVEEGLFTPASESADDTEEEAAASVGLVEFEKDMIAEGVTVSCGIAETFADRRIVATAKAPTICLRRASMVTVWGAMMWKVWYEIGGRSNSEGRRWYLMYAAIAGLT